MTTLVGTPARTMLRIAVRRGSRMIRPGWPASRQGAVPAASEAMPNDE
jgi:hypothetical protein